jgi:hypothetical protein
MVKCQNLNSLPIKRSKITFLHFITVVKEHDERKRKVTEKSHSTLSPADKLRRTLKEERKAEEDLRRYEDAVEKTKEHLANIKKRKRREEDEFIEQETGEAM